MKARVSTVSALVTSICLCLIGCIPAQRTLDAPTVTVPPAATPTATPTSTSTPTPVPVLTATAQAFDALLQATEAASTALQGPIGVSTHCQAIPAEQSRLTSPVPLPAEIGQALGGLGVIFRVPSGTVLRAPADGTIRAGPYYGAKVFSRRLDCWTIVRDDSDVWVCFPSDGSQTLLPGFDLTRPDQVEGIQRGDPITRLDGSTVAALPGMIAGLSSFNVLLQVSTPLNPFPPYGGGDVIPVGLSGDAWYGGFPTSCDDWLAQPTLPPLAQAIATAPPYPGVIPAPAGRIAFLAATAEGQDVFVTDLADGTIRQVTHGQWDLTVWQTHLGWHPDGQHLSFYAIDVENEQRELVLLDIETGETEIVLSLPAEGGSSEWSPDGSRLLWSTGNTLYLADARNLNPQPILEAGSYIVYATWSPDAQQIALLMERQDATSFELYLISPDGTGLTRVTDFYGRGPTQGPYIQLNAAWSADGSRLAFTLVAGPRQTQRVTLCVLTPTNGDASCLEGLPLDVKVGDEFAWLPDNRRLLLQSGYPPKIYTLDVENGDVLNLTHDPAWDECNLGQALSPDGQFLVFTSDRDHWESEVYILHIPSGEVVVRLTADFVRQMGAVWSRE